MNNIVLSFDYEIYFDGSNHYEALLENTKRILDIADTHKVKLVFFIDIYYLIKLEENKLTEPYSKIKDQIHSIQKLGHEIQYHYHPHWINSVYNKEENRWVFDSSEYSFSDIIDKYGLAFTCRSFIDGISKMKAEFNYSPFAYRSGGLSIDKNQDELIKILIQNGFVYDSSVMPGLYLHGKYIHIDHIKAPKKALWKIDMQSGFMSESSQTSNTLLELPIMTIGKNDLQTILRLYTSISYRLKGIMNTKPISNQADIGKPFDLGIEESVYPNSITFDKSDSRDIILLKFFTSQFFRIKNGHMCILSHPKSFIQNSFEVFELYLLWLKSNPATYRVSGFIDLPTD